MSRSKSQPLAADLLTSFSSTAFAERAINKFATASLGADERHATSVLQIEACGAIDEANCAIGLARVATATALDCARIDAMLLCAQNDLFDLSAHLCMPQSDATADREPQRIVQAQVDRLERKIDELNAGLTPSPSFVPPGGSSAAAALHLARTVIRRAERALVALAHAPDERIGEAALKYVNRLSDFLFVVARHVNHKSKSDILRAPA